MPAARGDSEFATAVSTLAIVVVFVPLRRRVQQAIDRRFYRHKYDAARTLAAFGAALRDDAQTDLNLLSGASIGAVQETVEPTHVSLWLRPAGGRGQAKS